MACRNVIVCLLLVIVFSPAIRADDAAGKPIRSKAGSNFLVSAPTDELAQAVLNRAEQLRRDIAREWLGRELPPSVGHTVVDVFVSVDQERALTSPSRDLRRPTFMMWLTTSPEGAVGPLLAHEVTHVVLLSRYPGRVPPWVDEGIACRYDDDESKAIRRDLIAWYRDTGNWPSLADTLRSEEISRWDHGSFAVSESLVEFLLARGKKEQLLACTADAHERGWDAALRSHYSLDGIPALEKAWQAWVMQSRSDSFAG